LRLLALGREGLVVRAAGRRERVGRIALVHVRLVIEDADAVVARRRERKPEQLLPMVLLHEGSPARVRVRPGDEPAAVAPMSINRAAGFEKLSLGHIGALPVVQPVTEPALMSRGARLKMMKRIGWSGE
jgi:hypothetical protein